MSLGETIRAGAREWRILAAIIAVASFGLLVPLWPTAARRIKKEAGQVQAVREFLASHQLGIAEKEARTFLEQRSKSPWVPEVQFLWERSFWKGRRRLPKLWTRLGT